MSDVSTVAFDAHPDRRFNSPCSDHERRISLTEQAVMSIKTTNEGLTTKMDLLLSQMTKVALLEEKHVNQQMDVNRAHDKIAVIDKGLAGLSEETKAYINYSKGRDKVLWVLAAGLAGLFVKVVFFAAHNGMTP